MGSLTCRNSNGSSCVDLAILSSNLFATLGQLEVLPLMECSDHMPILLGFLAGHNHSIDDDDDDRPKPRT